MTNKKTTDKKKKNEGKKEPNLKKEIEELKEELKQKEDKILRTLAELQNYQKRMQKELVCREEETRKKYLEELLDLHELLKKAYEDKDPKEGLKLLLKNINNFFEKEEIKPIKCIGECFNHNLHHAVTTIEKDDCKDNTIIEEVKKGYLLGGKLLRPAHVIVAKNKDEN